ncbi:MAG: hypothetical protein ACI81R_002318 [Bradymonadia bacterium]|jgi:hypothetical protein
MRRSSFKVHFEDGRVEALTRDEIRARLTVGELTNRDAISIANGRPKQPGAFPAFSDVAPPVTSEYPVVGGAEKKQGASRGSSSSGAATRLQQSAPTSRRTTSSMRSATTSGARAVQRASLRPPSVTDAASSRRVVHDVRASGASSRGSATAPKVMSTDVMVAVLDWGEPIPLEMFSGSIAELRERLWRSPPPAIVGCDALAGRHTAVRSAAERQSMIRTRLDEKPNAGDRILLEDCKSMIDLSLRIVTQPAKWREWQQRCRDDGTPVSIGVFGKIQQRNRTGSAPRSVKQSTPESDDVEARLRRMKRLHPQMDEAGLRMLVAAGADMFEDSGSAKRVVKGTKKGGSSKNKSTTPAPISDGKAKAGFLELPPWLSGLFGKKKG